MIKFVRQLIALFCLVAMVCGGQVSVCACELDVPEVACESHSHDSEQSGHHDHTAPGDDACCPCALCHSCPHVAMALPLTLLGGFGTAIALMPPSDDAGIVPPSLEIFIPPKV